MHLKPPDITESVSELKRLLRKTPVGYQKQRLMALYLFRSGQAGSRKQVADLIGVHRKTVGQWLSTYASEGLECAFGSRVFPRASLSSLPSTTRRVA